MDYVKLCLKLGAAKAAEMPVSKLVLQSELRVYCEQNRCGRYHRNYTCPPLIGEISQLIHTLKTFSKTVIWQNIYQLEDSFDFEGMALGQRNHHAMTLKAAQHIYREKGRDKALVLSAGGCTHCAICACQTSEPCRDPDNALSSLEAYGINVSQIENVSDMKYINGANTVTYFAGVFYNP
jgi:predicted metal-binding protein